MTIAIDWGVKPQTKQTNYWSGFILFAIPALHHRGPDKLSSRLGIYPRFLSIAFSMSNKVFLPTYMF